MLLHPKNQLDMKRLTRQLPQSLLMSGESGCDLLGAAKELTQTTNECIVIDPGEKATSIDEIRSLYKETRNKTTFRVIILVAAERMSAAAQNAFLKLLEEPIEGNYFILLSHHSELLLPTIHSRVQTLTILPVTDGQSRELLKTYSMSTADTQKALFIAKGLPLELKRLATDDAYKKKQFEGATTAKAIITGSTHEKLTLLQSVMKDRIEATLLLELCARMFRSEVERQPTRASVIKLDKMMQIIKTTSERGNIRIQLLRFALL